jgi:hypothetical protein
VGRRRKKWRTRKGKDGIKTFHANHCKTQNGEFLGWQKPRADRLMLDLAKVIGNSDLYIIGMTVLMKDWENFHDEVFKRRYQTPYNFCFEGILGGCQLWSEHSANNEPVAIVFAQHQEYGKLAAILAEDLIKTKELKNIASITFSTPEKMVSLQLADLTANLVGERSVTQHLPASSFFKNLYGSPRKQKNYILKLGDTKLFKEALQMFANPHDRFNSPKFKALLAQQDEKKLREQRKSWGLLPTVKAAVEKFRPRKKK